MARTGCSALYNKLEIMSFFGVNVTNPFTSPVGQRIGELVLHIDFVASV